MCDNLCQEVKETYNQSAEPEASPLSQRGVKMRLLKVSSNHDPALDSKDIIALHFGHYSIHGEVAYSTDLRVAEKPDYVILVQGNEAKLLYLCHVKDYAYKPTKVADNFIKLSPHKYISQEDKNTWFIFDEMWVIPTEVLSGGFPESNTIVRFAVERSNNKEL